MIATIKKRLKTDFYKDSFWALIGNVIFRGSGLVSSILLARILDKHIYGEFNSLKNTLTTLAIFTTFGLGYTSTKFVAESLSDGDSKKVIRKIYNIALVFSIIVSICIFIGAEDISTFYYNNTSFEGKIKILSLWIVMLALGTAQSGIIAGLRIFQKLTYVNISVGILTVIVIPICAFYYGIVGACVSLMIIQTINCFINHLLIRRTLQSVVTEPGKVIDYRKIIIYSLPLTLIEAIYSLCLWINYYLIQNNYDYGEVALYSTAMQWYILLLFIPMVLRNVILSYFSNNGQSDDDNIFGHAILLSFISTVIPSIIIVILAGLIENLYGKDFTGLANIIRLVSLIPLLSSVMNVMEQYLFSKSKNWTVFGLSFIKDGGTCILFLMFIYTQHVERAAFYLILSYLIMNAISFVIYAVIFFRKGLLKRRIISTP